MHYSRYVPTVLICACVLFINGLQAQESPTGVNDVATDEARPYTVSEERTPCDNYDPLRRPFFGDTHVHTAYSFDARSQDTRNTPSDAYNFAKGGRMGIQPYDSENRALRHIQIDRPLDFTAVTDHSEFLGEVRLCQTPGADGYWHPVCMAFRWAPEMVFLTLGGYGLNAKQRWGLCGDGQQNCFATANSVWREIQEAAEQAYDRSGDCQFTSFVGYEWTASVGSGQNLHHNVVFRNDRVPDRALSWIESPSQVDLWDYLEKECVRDKPGCDAVAIPHNSNLSGGLMFETARVENIDVPTEPATAAEAQRRARWTPLFEMMQHKGSSECDSRLPVWAEDEHCDFEKMDYDRFGGKTSTPPGGAVVGVILNNVMPLFMDDDEVPVTQPPTESNFVRYALKKGLQQEAELGANGLKYGFISSTDTHIAAPGLAMEKNHPGHGGAGMPASSAASAGLPDDLEYGPGGLAVLYAEENTRDSLFAAMQRREAYATSGTRPILRFFGGWDFADSMCSNENLAAEGYANGVSMGG
ncbi:MAG: DUF3604 domain-containing protein, partial [Pseudomonadales bacterium]